LLPLNDKELVNSRDIEGPVYSEIMTRRNAGETQGQRKFE